MNKMRMRRANNLYIHIIVFDNKYTENKTLISVWVSFEKFDFLRLSIFRSAFFSLVSYRNINFK